MSIGHGKTKKEKRLAVNMEKAKTKKEKEYLSILFVPHSTGDIKEYRLTAFHTKLVIQLLQCLRRLHAWLISL